MDFELSKNCSECGSEKSTQDLITNRWTNSNECEECWKYKIRGFCNCGEYIDDKIIQTYKLIAVYIGKAYMNCFDCFKREIFGTCMCGGKITGSDILLRKTDKCSKCYKVFCDNCFDVIQPGKHAKVKINGYFHHICEKCFTNPVILRCECGNPIETSDIYLCKKYHNKALCKKCFMVLRVGTCEFVECLNSVYGLDVILKNSCHQSVLLCQKHFSRSIIKPCVCGKIITGETVIFSHLTGSKVCCYQCDSK